ncbi:hypothetical protein Tco_0014210 [Tanacetum coccineum]
MTLSLQADMELKDTIVVAMPKLVGEWFYTCTVHVEYEWKPPRPSDVVKNLKKPRQVPRGVLPTDVVGNNTSSNKKKDVESRKEKANMNESAVERAWRLQKNDAQMILIILKPLKKDLEAKDVVVAQAQTRKDILKSSSKREINHMAERKYLVKFMSTILPSLRAKFPALLVTGEDLYVRPNAMEELVKGAFSIAKGIGHILK